jgi:hypothetical protein
MQIVADRTLAIMGMDMRTVVVALFFRKLKMSRAGILFFPVAITA